MGSTSSGHKTMSSGSSGGGSINIFYKTLVEGTNIKYDVKGGASGGGCPGGAGGSGTITKGKIEEGIFRKE